MCTRNRTRDLTRGFVLHLQLELKCLKAYEVKFACIEWFVIFINTKNFVLHCYEVTRSSSSMPLI